MSLSVLCYAITFIAMCLLGQRAAFGKWPNSESEGALDTLTCNLVRGHLSQNGATLGQTSSQ